MLTNMRLEKVEFCGYKRFLNPTLLIVGRPITAIIGRNEVGKSSVFAALNSLNYLNWNSEELNANHSQNGNPVLRAEFTIDDNDLGDISSLYLKADSYPRKITIQKDYKGRISQIISPPPEYEDITPLAKLAGDSLDSVLYKSSADAGGSVILAVIVGMAQTPIWDLQQALISNKTLESSHRELISTLAEGKATQLISYPPEKVKNIREAFTALDSALDFREKSAIQRVGERLVSKLPKFMLFDPQENALSPTISLTEHSEEETELRESFFWLLRFGGQSGKTLLSHAASNKRTPAITLLSKAQQEINKRLANIWISGTVEVRLILDGWNLELLVAEKTTGDVLPFTARSQGFKILLSLLAFLQQHEQQPNLVVMIDEIETHLHIDAQRSLIQMLESLSPEWQFIYTTHSPFALTSDISAIREVEADPEGHPGTSIINNHVWRNTTDGLIGLHVRMGAASIANWLPRHTLIVEGVTDAALIPRLLSEVLSLQTLEVMCIPGYVYAGKEVLVFEDQAKYTAYLFDGDKSGSTYAKKLQSRGIDETRIMQWSPETTLEDYLDEGFFLKAVELAARVCKINAIPLRTGDVPGPNRYAQLEEHYKKENRNPPSKIKVIESVLDLWSTFPRRIDTSRQKVLKDIAENIVKVLNLKVHHS